VVLKILRRPSVEEERRREGCEGWRDRVVMVSVWDSMRDSVGDVGLRVSLLMVRIFFIWNGDRIGGCQGGRCDVWIE
jgi:hypothetical protein